MVRTAPSGAAVTRYRHGMARSKLYGVWSAMLARCRNPNVDAYKNYGGRGITVCERWQLFDNFHADMGEPPAGMTLERRDNDGPYDPSNCIWASRKDQSRNQRGARPLIAFGTTKPLSQWADEYGIKPGTLWARIAKGWETEEAIARPLVRQKPGTPRGTRLRDIEEK